MRSVVLALTLLAATAAPAGAATVQVRLAPGEWRAEYLAAPGERNDVSFARVDGYTLRIADASLPLVAGEGCRLLDPRTAECGIDPNLPYMGINGELNTGFADLGDGDDTARVGQAPVALVADGGPGNDVLEGGRGYDRLNGGGGRDRLRGEVLRDGDRTGASDRDVLEGALVDYSNRTEDLVVDLARPARNEDLLRSVGDVRGGSGDDDIGGNGAVNRLNGGPGDDHVDGEGGHDFLFGGLGDDRVHGHAGDDYLIAGGGRDDVRGDAGDDRMSLDAADVARCGPGFDGLGGFGMEIGRDCEGLGFRYDFDAGRMTDGEDSFRLVPHPAVVPGGILRFTITCRMEAGSGGSCAPTRGTIVVRPRGGGPVLGSGDFERPLEDGEGPPETFVGTVKLGRRGQRLLARRTGFVARFEVSGERLPPGIRWTTRLGGAG